MNACDGALFTTLTAATGITALVSTRVYNTQAPQEATEPYIIFNKQSDISDYTFGAPKFRSFGYLVKGVCHSRYPKAAGAIDDAIEAALHDAALSVSGWTLLYCRRESGVHYAEGEYTHRGGVYRIELEQ